MATPETEETTVVVEAPASGEKAAPEERALVVEAPPAEGGEEVVADANANAGDGTDTSRVEASLPSFKEESYFVADLKEPEKKALQELKEKIEEGIRVNAFQPPKVEAVKDAEPEKGSELVAEAESKEAASEKTEEKTEEQAEAVEAAAEPTLQPSAGTAEAVVVTEPESVPTEAAAPPVSDAATTEAPATEGGSIAAEEVSPDTVIDEDISLWGVPLLPSKGDPNTDVILLKFLRARDSKVGNAFAMLKDTILWRKKFGADSILEEELGTDFEGLAYLHGFDKEGHPVSYNIFGALNDKDLYQKAFGDQSKTEKFLRWRVQLLEKSIELLNFSPGGANALVQVIDLKDSPWPAKKELRLFINQALNLLQDNYPELVVKNVLINVPWYFSALYSIISPFLSQRTKSKFVLVRQGKVTEALLKLIPAEQLPVQYGGLSRLNDEDFGDAVAPVTELVVKAGEKQFIEFEVPAAGGTVLWDFAVLGWDISYGAEFVPSAEGGYTTIVEKTKKITSQEEPVRNAFKASEAGKVILIIDNSASRKKKTAVYRYLVKQPGVVTELAG
ncbi:hypothetical protein O6H91_06G014000 [Diphasiastrum complanatum]|uniref:Uncharacterized protein n=1 Tax=Diphasiastrum complanatum TaxID=34168 RepID=A0ACC2DB46_DIPCM|nr:hypothetical protein O6H91_06G014000 [Diphasiastrum complanatum]